MAKKMFIHIPKCAGMTVRHSTVLKDKITPCTSQYIDPSYLKGLLARMKETQDHPGIEHTPYSHIRQNYRDNCDFFAIVRNPWDRVVSRYFFAKKVIFVEKKVPESYADTSSFEAFLEERHKWGNDPFMVNRAVRGWYPATQHVTDETGNVACDIMRFEHLNDDLCRYFNIPEMTRARNVTALNSKHYSEMYTPETKKIVEDWYASDIEEFGFKFLSGATKNTVFK